MVQFLNNRKFSCPSDWWLFSTHFIFIASRSSYVYNNLQILQCYLLGILCLDTGYKKSRYHFICLSSVTGITFELSNCIGHSSVCIYQKNCAYICVQERNRYLCLCFCLFSVIHYLLFCLLDSSKSHLHEVIITCKAVCHVSMKL